MSGTTTEHGKDQTTTPAAVPVPAPVLRHHAAVDVALVATFAAFIAVCSIVPGVPGPSGVPFTLQTFAVVLAGLVLGARRGTAAVALYLVVGLAGVPVFADHTAGLAVLTGPTGGYLVGFLAAAAVAGTLVRPALRLTEPVRTPARRAVARYAAILVAGLVASPVVLDVFGVLGLMWRAGLSFHAAFAANLPFVPGDVIKTALAALVTVAVFRAFPDLARTRR